MDGLAGLLQGAPLPHGSVIPGELPLCTRARVVLPPQHLVSKRQMGEEEGLSVCRKTIEPMTTPS
jgi:hypothetical protein